MALLARAALLAALLTPALLLAPQGLPTADTVPSINLTFDPRTRNLTWRCTENITAVLCAMTTADKGPAMVKGKRCHCTFQDSILHTGVTFTVTANIGHRQIVEKLVYTNPGRNGTAAENFSCFIYDADFMNCTWAKGLAAPDDVQYFLHLQDIKTRRERECNHYVSESGTHVGCHLDYVSELRHHIQVLVSGTSQQAAIQFFDATLLLKQIEIHSPPSNVSVACNTSHCVIRWEKPRSHFSTSNRDFQYQLRIQRQNREQHSDNPLVEVSGDSGNKYNFRSPQPRAKHTVQIRAADSRVLQWGAWSPPAEFGSGERPPSLVHVYLLVILGTVIGTVMLGYLFKRFLGTPIPQIRDKLNKEDDEIIWEELPPASGKGDPEEAIAVEEVRVSSVSVCTSHTSRLESFGKLSEC
ncbi:granulocyte-macrophage colony-stimulating factor receptor subunit alpha-like [Pteronotus mesoamericanus]|uniref:granulocyte-macrophage colony-stimulating factor receptor subunit alpha-like n=1 Tax=Pteronotus mesoamericanus TaxID=1884717 RepID=UPI0023EB7F72|nr:granulocyte-macrophage colony-stimulating factor receptor subunit alpha-like [Pteronotus parnellii mesoamericanus]